MNQVSRSLTIICFRDLLTFTFWNHVVFNLTTWIRQIEPKCSIKRVLTRLYYCIIMLRRIHWKPCLLIKKRRIFTLSLKHLGPICLFHFCLLHDAKIRSCKGGVVIAIGIIFRNLRILAYVWDFSVALKSE